MQFSGSFSARHIAAVLLLASAAALAACAGNPAIGSGNDPTTDTASAGELILTVTSQQGAPLDRAEVNLRSTGGDSYRARGFTNASGMATFNRLPAQVQVEVRYQSREERFLQRQDGEFTEIHYLQGLNSGLVDIEGGTQLRMTVDVTEEVRLEERAASGPNGGRGGFGGA
jgi:hypothetical protein